MALTTKVAWSLIERIGQQGVAFIVFSIVAAFIGPSDYGVASVVFIYFHLSVVVLSGFLEGIVVDSIEDTERLSTFFWLNILFGSILSCLCYFSGQLFAIFTTDDRYIGILQAYSVVPILFALASVPSALAVKRGNFKLLAARTILSGIVSGIAGVFMASRGYGAYAIVVQQITMYTAVNLFIWPASRWKPRFIFRMNLAAISIRHGISYIKVGSISFVEQQAPRFVILVFCGSFIAGLYSFATRIRQSAQEIIVTAPANVLFTVLAKHKSDQNKQIELTFAVLTFVLLIILPFASTLLTTIDVLIPTIFGEQWDNAVRLFYPVLWWLCLQPYISVLSQIFRANGKSLELSRINFWLLAFNLLTLPVTLLDDGVNYYFWFCALISTASIPAYSLATKTLIGIDAFAIMKRTLRITLGLPVAILGGAVYSFFNRDAPISIPAATLEASISLICFYSWCAFFCRRDIKQAFHTFQKAK